MRLLIAVLVAVAYPYILLKELFFDLNTILILWLAYYFIVKYFTMGQTFVNQVGVIHQVKFKIVSLSLIHVSCEVYVANTSCYTHYIFLFFSRLTRPKNY